MSSITITLAQIKAQNPCREGWDKLTGHMPDTDMMDPFPMRCLLDTNGLNDAVWATRCLPQHGQQWRRYTLQGLRLLQPGKPTLKRVLDAAERVLDGEQSLEEFENKTREVLDIPRREAIKQAIEVVARPYHPASFYVSSICLAMSLSLENIPPNRRIVLLYDILEGEQ